jgi:hypothetical protein
VKQTPIKYNATVLNAFEAGCGNVVCFLTEEISSRHCHVAIGLAVSDLRP